MFCRSCGKEIESGARFCRFCGSAQQDSAKGATTRPAAAGSTLERRLRQLFPRHHLQDRFMQVATVAAAFLALFGFIIALLGNPYGEAWILFSIALLLFLMLRETTLAQVRGQHGHTGPAAGGGQTRYHAARPAAGATAPPSDPEAAPAESASPSSRHQP